jgi:hypothetical protein
VTHAGFRPVVSGNPGGRPRGLGRRVRELVGNDGEAIAKFMFDVMAAPSNRTSERMEAAKWLADRGFGKALRTEPAAFDWRDEIDLGRLTLEERITLAAILERADPRG